MKPEQSLIIVFILTTAAAIVYSPAYIIATAALGLTHYLVNHYSEQATVKTQSADIKKLSDELEQLKMSVKQLLLKQRGQ